MLARLLQFLRQGCAGRRAGAEQGRLSAFPIGLGPPLREETGPQRDWVNSYELSRYPGLVHQDGVGALVDTIMNSVEPITLIGIGPLRNIAAALERDPRIAERARFVGMQGSIRRGYRGLDWPVAEANVRAAPESCREVFSAPWDVTITPLDTCNLVRLEGDKYRTVRDCEDLLVQALIENYRIWVKNMKNRPREEAEKLTKPLNDTVAVYLAFSAEHLVMEEMGLRVSDRGYTVIDDGART